MSVFQSPGLYLRTPGGNVEDVDRMKAQGFRWLAWNELDHPFASGAWNVVASRCVANDMTFLPWLHARTRDDLHRLRTAAMVHGGNRAIFNCEQELNDGRLPPGEIAVAAAGLDAALATLPIPGWIPDHAPLLDMHVHVGVFPQEAEASQRPRDCRAMWFAEGFKRVTFMLGIHDLNPSALPLRHGGYAIYTADDAAGAYGAWAPTVLAPLDIPYRGPGYGPGKRQSRKSPYWAALKRILHEAGYGHFFLPDYVYNKALADAVRRLQREHGLTISGNYGAGVHEVLRTLPSARNGGGYACTEQALTEMQTEWR